MKTTKRAKSGIWWSALGAAVLTAGVAAGGPPLNASKKFSFQGVVSGIPDGDYEMKVDAIGGVTNHSVVFDATRKVPVRGGVFTLLIDEADGLLPAHFYKGGGTSFTFTLHVDHDPNQAGYDSVFSGIPVTAVPVAFVAHQALDSNRLAGVDISYPAAPTAGALSGSYDGKVLKLNNGVWELGPDNVGSTSVATTIADGLMPMLPSSGGTSKFLDGSGSWQILPSAYSLPAATTSALGGVKIPASGALSLDGSNALSLAVGTGANTVAAGNDARLSAFTASQDGLVPKPTSATGKFLKDDGTWDAPAGYTLPAATTSALGGVKIPSTGALSLNGSNVLTLTVGTGANTVAAGDDARFNSGVPLGTIITSVLSAPPTGYATVGGVSSRVASSVSALYAALPSTSKVLLSNVNGPAVTTGSIYAFGASDAQMMRILNDGSWSTQTSTTGSSWSSYTDGDLNDYYYDLVVDESASPAVWMALRNSTNLLRSTDNGGTWSPVTPAAFAGDRFFRTSTHFVAFSSGGAHTSTDGITWSSQVPTGLSISSPFYAAADDSGNMVISAGSKLIYSTDSGTTTGGYSQVDDLGGTYYNGVAYNGQKYCAITDSSNKIIKTSTNGTTWTSVTFPGFWTTGSGRIYGFRPGGANVFALTREVNASGNDYWELYLSPDCVTWNKVLVESGYFSYWKLAVSASKLYLMRSNTGRVITLMDDGANFRLPDPLTNDGLFRFIKL